MDGYTSLYKNYAGLCARITDIKVVFHPIKRYSLKQRPRFLTRKKLRVIPYVFRVEHGALTHL
ncbi:MAG: hypothetical protein ACPGQW_11395, partial [Paracoccaceae bacterium]